MTDAPTRPRKRASTRTARPKAAGTTGTGVFRPHVRGFGFVDLDVPLTGPDGAAVTSCFVPPPQTARLLDGDRVEAVFVLEPEGRATASEVALKERTRTEVFGVVEDGLHLRLDPHLGSGRWRLFRCSFPSPSSCRPSPALRCWPPSSTARCMVARQRPS